MEQWRQQMDQRIVDDVERCGVSVTAVLGDARHLGWAYTTGLWGKRRHPEIIVSALPERLAHGLLNTIARQVASGKDVRDGTLDPDELTNGRCAFRPIGREGIDEHWANTVAYYGHDSFEAVQLIWGDEDRRLPWEAGWSPSPPQQFFVRGLELATPQPSRRAQIADIRRRNAGHPRGSPT